MDNGESSSVAERTRTLQRLLRAGMGILAIGTIAGLFRGSAMQVFPYAAMLGGHAVAYTVSRTGRLRLAVSVHVALYLAIVGVVMFRLRVPGWVLGPGGAMALEVMDTGEGMSAEVKARLFEPFFTTKVPGKGMGIGLASVREIVEQSGGKILVDSEVHKGACFTVLLPVASPPVR